MAKGSRGTRSKADQEFVSEAEDILERMREDLSQVADAALRGADAPPDSINGLFRSAHSLKGLSGMFGFAAMTDLAHHLEDMLDALRMGRLHVSSEMLALFDDAIDAIGAALATWGTADESAETAIRALVTRIEGVAGGSEPEVADRGALALPDSMLRALTEYEEHRLHENQRRGRGIYVVDVDIEIADFEEGLSEVSTAIKEVGEILSTLPSPGDTAESQIRFSLLTATDLSAADLALRLELSEDAVLVGCAPGRTEDTALPPDPPPTPEPRLAASAPLDLGDPARPASDPATLKSISDTVRGDIRKLDELMNMVGELAVQKGAIGDLADRLAAEPATSRAGAQLDKIHRGLERKLQELQAGVLEVRMVPLRQVFDKLTRVVRRLRLDLRKEVALEIRGADTELDKLIVEELVDPLMHVVRNAFDHAIEDAATREEAGKPAQGTIRIEAFQRGNDVVIAVTDDGAGIDADGIHARAVERGLISPTAELTTKERLELIFQPGLSTRDEVTETSGRGVGMDVVRSNIAALGGVVGIDSTPGEGTTITFTLPITLAIIQALIVGAGSHRFAVPLHSVRETLLIEVDQIQRSEGRSILNLRGDPLVLRSLAGEFDLDVPSPEAKPYVVVLGMGDTRMGLLVDRLEGQQDTVIKPIQGPVRQVRGIAGATEIGELGAVLVLDVSALVEDVGRWSDA